MSHRKGIRRKTNIETDKKSDRGIVDNQNNKRRDSEEWWRKTNLEIKNGAGINGKNMDGRMVVEKMREILPYQIFCLKLG